VAIEEGESVRVRVRVLEGGGGALMEDGRFRAEVVRDGMVVQSVPLARVAAPDVGRLETTIGMLGEGDYTVRVVDRTVAPAPVAIPPSTGPATTPAGAATELSLPLHVGSTYEAELADVSGDYSILQRLAEASGGEFFTLDQVDRLAERLTLAAERRPRYVEQRLWDSPLLFVFVVGCLAAEWAARKRVGLV
jgi:hypothetical protein